MEKNIQALAGIHTGLSEDFTALNEHWSAAALEARSLGFLAEGETAVRLSMGSSTVEARAKPTSPGSIVYYEAPAAMSDAAVKELSGLAALAWMLACLAYKAFRRKGSQRAILVQDASRT